MTDSPDTRLHVVARYMTDEDIDRVVILDRIAFPNPWPRRIYQQELAQNDRAKLYIVELADVAAATNGRRPNLFQRLFGRHDDLPIAPMVAYGGYWCVAGEAHISTLAVHPDWRGRKLGELLVWLMARQAVRHRANMLTLEVRISNTLAQNLYRKYGFEILSRRSHYYSDNGEDAFNMGIGPLDDAYRVRLVEYGKELARGLRVTDYC